MIVFKNYLFVTIAITSMLTSCGKKPTAEKQPNGELVLPAYQIESKSPLFLATESSSADYSGNLVLWKNGVTSAQISAISDASIRIRHERAEFLEFENSQFLPTQDEVRKVSQSQLAERAKLGKIEGDIASATRESTIQNSRTWFSATLSDLTSTGTVSESEKGTIERNFGLYCEAKIWELASSPLLQSKFNKRPTPLQICEPYYDSKGLLAESSPSCASSPEGRNYADCLWLEGVLKTQIFDAWKSTTCDSQSSGNPLATKTVGEVLPELIRSGIQGAVEEPSVDIGAGQTLTLENIAFDGASASLVKKLPTDSSLAFFAKCPFALREKVTSQLTGNGTAKVKSRDFLSIAEFRVTPNSATIVVPLLIPKASQEESNERTAARYASLGSHIRTIGSRESGKSVSDAQFNAPIDGPMKSASPNPELMASFQSSQAFANLRPEESLVPAELRTSRAESFENLGRIEKHLIQAQDQLKFLTAQKEERFAKVIDAVGKGAEAAMVPGAATIFAPFSISLTRNESGIGVLFNIIGGTQHAGCVSIAESIPCSLPQSLAAVAGQGLSSLNFDADAYQLSFDLTIADARADRLIFATTQVEKSELSEVELNDKVLHVDLWFNQLNERLQFFTGKVQIREGAKVLNEGSVSGDAFNWQKKS